MIERSVDAQDGIIIVVSVGEATRAEIDAHYDELRRMISKLRAAGKPIRVLSDQTRAVWLPDDLNQHILSQIGRTFDPGERLAILMATPDRKFDARAILGVETHAVFHSRTTAEIWLMDPSQPPPSTLPAARG